MGGASACSTCETQQVPSARDRDIATQTQSLTATQTQPITHCCLPLRCSELTSRIRDHVCGLGCDRRHKSAPLLLRRRALHALALTSLAPRLQSSPSTSSSTSSKPVCPPALHFRRAPNACPGRTDHHSERDTTHKSSSSFSASLLPPPYPLLLPSSSPASPRPRTAFSRARALNPGWVVSAVGTPHWELVNDLPTIRSMYLRGSFVSDLIG